MPSGVVNALSIVDRRRFFQTAAGAAGLLLLNQRSQAQPKRRLKVAAVFTEMSYRSHAHVIIENFLEPYDFNGQVTDSGCEVVSFYADQFPEKRDLAWPVAKAYGIPIFSSIQDALTLGGKQLAVDAVLSIGEHGNYPLNSKGQREYPRKRFFDEIVKVFRTSGRVVPVFNDKHLSYRWDWAMEMVDTARKMNIPLMAGSSVPLAQRVPMLELPNQMKIEEAVTTHGGGLDSYDFHGLEVLQSMVESRVGGETGVENVQYLGQEALWKAAEEGQWSPKLLLAALQAEPSQHGGSVTEHQLKSLTSWALVLHYRDGLRGMVVKTNQDGTHWHFACRAAGEPKPLATSFYVGPWQNRCLFKALSHAIQTHFRIGKAPYPVERTLLTTGLVEAGVESHFHGDKLYRTPHLNISYAAQEFRGFREMGASWKLINENTPEPNGIDHLGKVAERMFTVSGTR
ncbi:MAG TPA: hypothetical protein PLN21_16560 [Gemmatales bacterium]|nr:hypothetical protein [Gemmatales bacterium]